jgi:ribulose-5-phosphate 4-epimerase/fuculose-1-phosphate aldolase
MTYIDEGYIKFNLIWKKARPFSSKNIEDLIYWRDICIKKADIGYNNIQKVGYGNISKKQDDSIFTISGSQTGHIIKSNANLFTKVIDCKPESNTVSCEGPVKASSESMTHYACYNSNKNINAVIHIHNKKAWIKYKGVLPTTPKNIRYGTLEMANAIKKLINEGAKIIIMDGHEDGLVFVGHSLDDTGSRYLELIEQV